MRIILWVGMSFVIASCGSTVKTKQDCVSECGKRGAEYVGVIPKGLKTPGMFPTYEDVCQCK